MSECDYCRGSGERCAAALDEDEYFPCDRLRLEIRYVREENTRLREALRMAEEFVPGHQSTMYETMKRAALGDQTEEA